MWIIPTKLLNFHAFSLLIHILIQSDMQKKLQIINYQSEQKKEKKKYRFCTFSFHWGRMVLNIIIVTDRYFRRQKHFRYHQSIENLENTTVKHHLMPPRIRCLLQRHVLKSTHKAWMKRGASNFCQLCKSKVGYLQNIKIFKIMRIEQDLVDELQIVNIIM